MPTNEKIDKNISTSVQWLVKKFFYYSVKHVIVVTKICPVLSVNTKFETCIIKLSMLMRFRHFYSIT